MLRSHHLRLYSNTQRKTYEVRTPYTVPFLGTIFVRLRELNCEDLTFEII